MKFFIFDFFSWLIISLKIPVLLVSWVWKI